jgi:hypothetical protein
MTAAEDGIALGYAPLSINEADSTIDWMTTESRSIENDPA